MGKSSIPACEVTRYSGNYLVLKHDVETDVPRALQMAKIENKFGHRGSYYVQAYLLNDKKNVQMLKMIQQMGNEVSYHYDVMDSNKGSLEQAIFEFDENRALFEHNGFPFLTVCQHGNPVVDRVGYTSNRDFFRSDLVQKKYSDILDIMVNFKSRVPTEYLYFSDAGRKFRLIYDPINNDVVNSDEKNIAFEDLDGVLNGMDGEVGNIISTHPHRWTKSAAIYIIRNTVFQCVKAVAKTIIKIPAFKKILSRYYYLAKKF